MTVPSDKNIAQKEIEKKSKYKALELEIQRMWHIKTVVIPVVDGAVKKGMVENIKKGSAPKLLLSGVTKEGKIR